MSILLRWPFFFTSVILGQVSIAQFGEPTVLYPSGGSSKLKAVDLDADGDLDLIGVFNNDQFKWFQNMDGPGTFASAEQILVISGECAAFAVSDLNSDGFPDILVLSDDDDDDGVSVHFNDGGVGFAAPSLLLLTPDQAKAITTADLNGDGFTDVIVTLSGVDGPGFGWFPGDGVGFGPLIQVLDLHEGPTSNYIAVGDLDLLGGLDVLLRGEGDQFILARNSAGDASAWSVEDLPIPNGLPDSPYRFPQLMDVDGDGDMDLAESRGPALHWLRNDLDEGGVLTFTERAIEPWTSSGNGIFAPAFCGIGASVVFVPSNPNLPVRWNSYLPVLNGFTYSNDLPTLPRGQDLLLADLNGDAKDDLVMTTNDGLVWFPSTITPPTTELQLPVLDTLCVGGTPVALPEAIPAGGRWFGVQVSNNLLFRANIGITVDHPLVHSAYELNGCPLEEATSIRLINGPVITTPVPPVICSADSPIQMISEPVSTQWYGLNGSSVLDPASFNGGYVVCEYTDGTGTTCSDLEGPILRWNSLPAALAPAGPFCSGDGLQTIVATEAPPFNTSWTGAVVGVTPTEALFDPSVGAGEYEVIFAASPFAPGQCANSDTLRIVVQATPEITFSTLATYCTDGEPITLEGAAPNGGTWSGAGVANGALDPALVGPGLHLLNYFVMSDDGCSAQASTTIELASTASVTTGTEDLLICEGDDILAFTAEPIGGVWDAPVSAGGELDPGPLEPGLYSVRYTYTDPRGCQLGNEPIIFERGAPKVVTIPALDELCTTTPPFELTGSASGTWSGAATGEGSSVLIDPGSLGPGSWSVTLLVTAEGECPGSATEEFIVDICSDVAEAAMIEASIFPNPFTTSTMLRFQGNGTANVDVFDAAGRCVHQRTVPANGEVLYALDLRDEAPGTYVVTITTNGEVHRLRAVRSE